jgi:hypothetical protein
MRKYFTVGIITAIMFASVDKFCQQTCMHGLLPAEKKTFALFCRMQSCNILVTHHVTQSDISKQEQILVTANPNHKAHKYLITWP